MATDKQKVLELAADRQHAQLPVEANGLGQAEEPHCGDLLRIGLVVNPRQVVVDAGFTITESACPPAVASAVIAVFAAAPNASLTSPEAAMHVQQGRMHLLMGPLMGGVLLSPAAISTRPRSASKTCAVAVARERRMRRGETSPPTRTVREREWRSSPMAVKGRESPRATMRLSGCGVCGWRRGMRCWV